MWNIEANPHNSLQILHSCIQQSYSPMSKLYTLSDWLSVRQRCLSVQLLIQFLVLAFNAFQHRNYADRKSSAFGFTKSHHAVTFRRSLMKIQFQKLLMSYTYPNQALLLYGNADISVKQR